MFEAEGAGDDKFSNKISRPLEHSSHLSCKYEHQEDCPAGTFAYKKLIQGATTSLAWISYFNTHQQGQRDA